MTHEHGTVKCRIISDCKRGLEAIMIDLAVLDKTDRAFLSSILITFDKAIENI